MADVPYLESNVHDGGHYFAGGTFDQQKTDPVNLAFGDPSNRDIPKGLVDNYYTGRMSREDALAKIAGTPRFNPNIGPLVDTGNGLRTGSGDLARLNPQTNQYEIVPGNNTGDQGFKLNAGIGTGFSTNQTNLNSARAQLQTMQRTSIPGTIDATKISSTASQTAPNPTLPQPTYPSLAGSFADSTAASIAQGKNDQENLYNTKIADLKAKEDATTKTIADAQGNLSTEEMSGWKQQLQATLMEREHVQENFDANQASIKAMEDIMNSSNATIQAAQDQTGLRAIKNPTIALMKSDAVARIGVIKAVMAARDRQISTAEKIINDTLAVVQADHQDQINYYKTILDTANKGLISLKTDEKGLVDKYMSYLQTEQKATEASADKIKSMMIDPAKAQILYNAGVKLTDNVEQINAKIAKQMDIENRIKIINDQGSKGYTYLPAGPGHTPSKDVITMQVPGTGETLYFQRSQKSTGSSTETSDAQIIAAEMDKVKGQQDGFINPTDWQAALNEWMKAGHTADSFVKHFNGYANPNDTYQGIKPNKSSAPAAIPGLTQ